MHNHEGISPDQPAREVPRMHAAWKGAAIMLVAIVGFYVLREHWGHALGVAPYLLLLVCPLMHVFKHVVMGTTILQATRRSPIKVVACRREMKSG